MKKRDVITCEKCQRKMGDVQEGRCPYCESIIDEKGKLPMFKVKSKPTCGAFTGMTEDILMKEEQLRDTLGMAAVDLTAWNKILKKGEVVVGALKYEWKREETKGITE